MNTPTPVTLSPAATEQMLRDVAEQVAAAVIAGLNVEELQMMDLSTCAGFLGIPLSRAEKVLPYVELGPRTRRVRIADFKDYQERHMKRPKSPGKPLTVVSP